MILTGLVLILIAPENLSTAMLLFGVVFMMMFIGRVAAKKLLLLAGGLILIGALGVGTVVAIPAKTLHSTPDFTVWRPGRTVSKASSIKMKCPQPNSI